jgi:hypothetical protein
MATVTAIVGSSGTQTSMAASEAVPKSLTLLAWEQCLMSVHVPVDSSGTMSFVRETVP